MCTPNVLLATSEQQELGLDQELDQELVVH